MKFTVCAWKVKPVIHWELCLKEASLKEVIYNEIQKIVKPVVYEGEILLLFHQTK